MRTPRCTVISELVCVSLSSLRPMSFGSFYKFRSGRTDLKLVNRSLFTRKQFRFGKMFLLIVLTLLTALVLYIRHLYSFWQRKGFPSDKVKIPFGCLDSVVKRQRSFGVAIYDVYKNSKEKLVGVYFMHRPALLIRDAELARNIMVQNFESFHDRGIYVDEKNDPYSGHLFALRGDRWRTLRQKLSPSFTSGKLKGMFEKIEEVGDRMIEYLDKTVPEKGAAVVEVKDVLSKYGVDIIGSVIFGLENDSFKDPVNDFRMISKKLNAPTFLSVIKGTAIFLCPNFNKWLVKFGIEEQSANMMKSIVRQTVEFRESNNYSRKDLMQLLIQLRNTGKISSDDNVWSAESAADGFKSMSIECLAGQGFAFYAAGFETAASGAAFTLYELAQNPQIMAKVMEDIEQTIAKHDGKITYECIQDMKYLELCLMETVRKYPGAPILNRECTKDFPIPGTDLVIEKGTPIVISLFGIQRDEEYFPDPMKYEPERYLEESKNYNPIAYMPFGEGPRICIAPRMGKLNVKVALVKILTNYEVEAIEKKELEMDTFSVTIVPLGGVNVKLRRKLKPA